MDFRNQFSAGDFFIYLERCSLKKYFIAMFNELSYTEQIMFQIWNMIDIFYVFLYILFSKNRNSSFSLNFD
jgi:hypothetical protein